MRSAPCDRLEWLPLLLGFLLLWATGGARAVEPEASPEFHMSAEGEIFLEIDGSVERHTLEPGLPPVISDLIAKRVSTWRFEPIVERGVPVRARTRMKLQLAAYPIGKDAYRLVVAAAHFGVVEQTHNVPPSYPPSAIRPGVEADVDLVLHLDPDGRVVRSHVRQVSLSPNVASRLRETYRRRFAEAALAVVPQWRYRLGEVLGGVTVESVVRVPVTFRLKGRIANDRPRWTALEPGPIHPVSWATVPDPAGSSRGDVVAAALDSRFRLLEDVVGTSL